MLNRNHMLASLIACFALTSALFAQAPQQPTPEHLRLKELEGTWDAVVKMGPMESKGVMVYKLDLGGLWLTSEFQGEFAGAKFSGKGIDGYDPVKKKYVATWADSMSASMMVCEGQYDAASKTQVMTGEVPSPTGAFQKVKITTEHKTPDLMVWTMFGVSPDGKDAPMFTITYTRRK